MPGKRVLSRRLLFTIFTISGFSGLIYESIWSHYLKLFLGHAAYAQTLVLAIFMGGMALGAWLVARSTARLRNLLVAYAAVEILTGILALVFHKAYVGTTGFAYDSLIPSLESVTAIGALKWTLAALMILPQSILLGTTFPLISGGVIRRFPENSGETLAMLYFTNSLGAALGVLASGFWLIGAVGLPGTVMTAGLLNILLGVFVWVVARDRDAAAAEASADKATSGVARWVLVAALLAGLAAFVYEIAWTRMLSLVLGSSTHAFELMLSAFILGLALGGFWIRKRIGTITDAPRALAGLFVLMAVLGALTLPAYGYAFDVMAATLRTFAPVESGYAAFNVLSHFIAAVMMIPTTVVAGMTLPLMTHYLFKAGSGEQAIGKVYAANTVGAIAGVLIAIHLLLPKLNTKGAVMTAALVQVGIAALFMARARRTSLSIPSLAVGLCAVLGIALMVRIDPMRMASGVYRTGQAQLPPDTQVLFLRDGKTATISLVKHDDTVFIATNGKADAAINMGGGPPEPDEITMTMAAALPLSMHANPERIANIGIGSGLTSHVLLTSPTVKLLDSIEIEPAMAEAARIGFGPRVSKLFTDPRSQVHFEDAKTFFAIARKPYDVIISEPSNPWVSGVASLFSQEFYRHVKRYLAKDGLLVQWVQIYETDITVVASIVKALSAQFPEYAIYNTDDANLLIVASPAGKIPPVRADIFDGPVGDELRKVGMESIADFDVRRVGSSQTLQPLFASFPVPANSDYFPFVDLIAPKMRFMRRDALGISSLRDRPAPFMELAGEPSSVVTPVRSTKPLFLMRQRRVYLALEVVDTLSGKRSLGDLPLEQARAIMYLRAPEAMCTRGVGSELWLSSVRSIAISTSALLPVKDLQPVWNAIASNPCMAQLSDAGRREVEYLQAIALRDRPSIITLGTRFLQGSDSVAYPSRAQIVAEVGASMIGMRADAALARLVAQEGAVFASNLEQDTGLRLVLANAAARISTSAATP